MTSDFSESQIRLGVAWTYQAEALGAWHVPTVALLARGSESTLALAARDFWTDFSPLGAVQVSGHKFR